MSGRLQERVCFISGAASGIGRALALRFAKEGARLALCDIRDTPIEGGARTQDLLLEKRADFIWSEFSVADEAAVQAFVDRCVECFGRLDVMVPNAATSDGLDLTNCTEDSWDSVMAVNLKGVFFCLKAAVRQMLKQEPLKGDEARGRIVNISSQHGMVCSPGEFSYGVSKAGVVYMTRQIAVDYAEAGIICNAVSPGKIVTGNPDGANPNRLAYAKARTPMPRLGRPEDIANAAVFLASAEASYMTGHNLMVDGGWMAY